MPLEKSLVLAHQQVSREMYQMELNCPQIAALSQPGQFVHVKVNAGHDPLLRRPLSLYDVDKGAGRITLLYKVVGQGTEILSKIRAQEYIDLMGPLGQGFNTAPPGKQIVLIGGGVGIAPLVYLARVLKAGDYQVKVLHGADRRENLAAWQRLAAIGVDFLAATDDGSAGMKGLVTELLVRQIDPGAIDYIYACGPEAMMAAVAAYAAEKGIPGQVSLEEYMACGVGACLGCARRLRSSDQDWVKICKDGPVFAMEQIEWQNI